MARTRVQVGGVQQTIRRVRGMADLRTFKRIRVMVGGVMQTVFQYLTAVATPDSVSGSTASGTTDPVTTAPTAAVVTGGVAPFTYAWSEVDSLGGPWTIDNPTASVTTFTATVAAFDSATATFQCQVTDASSNVVTTNTVSATAINYGA